MAKLRCVFYDPDAVDAESRLSERAFEACARADVDVFELRSDAVEFEGEPRGVAFVMRALAYGPEQCIGVGAALAGTPVGAVWVGPRDLDVRGPAVRVAEADDDLFYAAVISELAQRR